MQIRQAHQSKETSDACRPLKSTDVDPTNTHSAAQGDKALVADSSVRQQLAGKIYETLRLSGINIKGETSGLARQFRWTKQASGTASTDKDVTGNTANARRAASSRVAAVSRAAISSIVQQLNVPLQLILGDQIPPVDLRNASRYRLASYCKY